MNKTGDELMFHNKICFCINTVSLVYRKTNFAGHYGFERHLDKVLLV